MTRLNKNKKAQVTIFIILAIVIVGGVGLYFGLRQTGLMQTPVPIELEPVYSYYLACVEAEAFNGASILGQQGGYIETPEFSPGTEYMPFSSQLDFLGIGVPYWYYIAGNGIEREQVPSEEKMESELNNFLEERIILCDFSQFENKGFEIDIGESEKVKTNIHDNSISINVNQELSINFGEKTWKGSRHSVDVNSNLGKFYDLAEKIYENQKETMFLENYAVDILRLYAPVDGSEIGCSPKIWIIDEIRNNLINALESNIPFTKIKGDYYSLSKEENKYFIHDISEDTDFNVNFMYLSDWPMKMEVWPSEDGILKADPVGLQEGLGMLGFCYVPYHFVYDFAYPVLIQLYSGSEMFQFPVVVYINKNQPRKALPVEGLPDVVPTLCEHKNTRLEVYTYNTNLEPVETDIKFKCFDTACSIGETIISEDYNGDAGLIASFPQCVNGFILAKAEGYKTSKYQVSSVTENSVIIVLDKKYKLDLEVKKGGISLNEEYAVVTFTKEDEVITLAYPEQKEIELTSGQYEIKSYVYSDSNIRLQGSSTEKCVDVPQTGVLGIVGLTEKKCFNLDIPDQVVSFAVSGGGTENYYIGESELESSNKLIIDSNRFDIPTKVEDLQSNYNNIDVSGLNILFE